MKKNIKTVCIITAAAILTSAAGICGIQAASAAGFSLTEADETVIERGDLQFTVYYDHAVVTKCLSRSGASIPAEIEGVPVTEIGKEAFAGLSAMQFAVIPSNIRVVGEGAFKDNPVLESVTMETDVCYISGHAFENCPELKTVVTAENLFEIGEDAFRGCKKLTGIVLPDCISYIGDGAFAGCESLTAVSVTSVAAFGAGTFEGCKALKTAEIDCFDIEAADFSGCEALENVTLRRIEDIQSKAFAECKSLKTLTIPASTVTIAADAFEGCGDLMLKVAKGSPAEAFARSHNMKYEITDAMETGGLMLGDLTGDCRVTIEDAQLALKAYTNILALKDSGLTDMQYNAAAFVYMFSGLLTVEDAQLILRYYTEKEVAGRDISWDDLHTIYVPETTMPPIFSTTGISGTCICDDLTTYTTTVAMPVTTAPGQ